MSIEFNLLKFEGLTLRSVSGLVDRSQMSELVDHAFAVPKGKHFFEDFPVWDENIWNPLGEVYRVGVFRGAALFSCAGARLASIKTVGDGRMPVALIGAVATQAAWRGRGLASYCVSEAVNWASKHGAKAALLWGSEHALYEKIGFSLVGTQVRVPLSALKLSDVSQAAPIGIGLRPPVYGLLRARAGGLVLTEREERLIAAHKNVEWYWYGRPERPRAYIALGRGIDLGGIIHEWGGQPDALQQLLAFARFRRGAQYLLGTREALQARGLVVPGAVEEPLALVRVLDPKGALAAYGDAGKALSLEGVPSRDWAKTMFGQLPLWVWGLDAV